MVEVAFGLFYLVGFVIFAPILLCSYLVAKEFFRDLRDLWTSK